MSYDWSNGFPGSDIGYIDPTSGDPGGWTPNFGGLGDTSDSSAQTFDSSGATIDPYNTSGSTYSGGFDPSTLGGLGGLAGGMGNFGGVPWAGLMQMLGGIGGYTTSSQGINQIQNLIAGADPWGSSGGRGIADQQLISTMGSPPTAADVPNLPGYQAGMDAVERSGAAQGYLGSGNMASAMLQYGGQEYQQAYGDWLSRAQLLTGLAGGNVQPGGDSAQLMGVLGQAEASKNASLINGLSGFGRTMTAAAPAPASGGGGGGGDSFGSILGGIGGLAAAFL